MDLFKSTDCRWCPTITSHDIGNYLTTMQETNMLQWILSSCSNKKLQGYCSGALTIVITPFSHFNITDLSDSVTLSSFIISAGIEFLIFLRNIIIVNCLNCLFYFIIYLSRTPDQLHTILFLVFEFELY